MNGIVKCPKCGKYMLVSKMVEEEGIHKGMHSAYCLHCKFTKYVK